MAGVVVGAHGGRGTAPAAARGARVLCVGADPAERAALAGLCEAAGAVPVTAAGRPDLRQWQEAALVLVASGAAPGGHPGQSADAVAGLPRRSSVLLVHGLLDAPAGGGARAEGGDEPPAATWRAAVGVGAEHVAVLPAAREWLVHRLGQVGRPSATVVGVLGARGGAGASAVAVALAGAAARVTRTDLRVMLLDADPAGGGLDLALGAEDLPGLRWPDLYGMSGPLPRGGLASALPAPDGVRLLSHGRGGAPGDPAAVAAVWEAAAREHDLVVVDLPRHPAAATVPAATAVPLDVVVLVCPAEVRAAASAPAVLLAWAPWRPGSCHLLVRGPSPGGLRPGDAAAAVRAGVDGAVPLGRVDVVRAEPGLARALEGGDPVAERPRSPLRRWAELWLDDVLATHHGAPVARA